LFSNSRNSITGGTLNFLKIGGEKMGFVETLSAAGITATILGVFLTIYGLLNNRTLKEESSNTREILKQGFQSTREMLLRMEQGQEETRKEIAEARKEIAHTLSEARREMAEALRYLAQLIVQEGERTREAIQAKP
jgi:hypothetical protein